MRVFNTDGKLDADVQDALYELGNAGVGMASTTMGSMLGVRVQIKAPKVVPVDEEILEHEDEEQIGMFMDFGAGINGSVLFLFDYAFIMHAVKNMTGCEYSKEELLTDEMSFSAIGEFANMASAAYMKAISGYTDMRIFLHPALVDSNKKRLLYDTALERVKEHTGCERAICVQTDFELTDENQEVAGEKGSVIMLPDEETIEKLMTALGL